MSRYGSRLELYARAVYHHDAVIGDHPRRTAAFPGLIGPTLIPDLVDHVDVVSIRSTPGERRLGHADSSCVRKRRRLDLQSTAISTIEAFMDDRTSAYLNDFFLDNRTSLDWQI